MGNTTSTTPRTESTSISNKRARLNSLNVNDSIYSNVVKEVIAPANSTDKRKTLIPDDVRQHILKYLSYHQIKILEMTSITTQQIIKKHCQPRWYGRDIKFDGKTLKFIPRNDMGGQSCRCNRGGIIGYNGICTKKTEIKFLATTDFHQEGYKLTVGFIRPPDGMTDSTFVAKSSDESEDDRSSDESEDYRSSDESEDDRTNDNSTISTVQSSCNTVKGFWDFHIPKSCTHPSQHANKVHRFYADIFICRSQQLIRPLHRRHGIPVHSCPATSMIQAFKHEGQDERSIRTDIRPSQVTCFHTEVIRGLPPPQHITILLSRIRSNTLRIHVKVPHHITRDEHILIHRYTEVSNNVSGPYTWFVELGPIRNENGSIQIA